MNPLARIIDANYNRAREALRVMEDAARFSLSNGQLVARLKGLRHALQDAVGLVRIDRAGLLASRDTEADVGAAIKTPTELVRADLHDAVAAAASRLSESLRSLEEAAKAIPEPSAAAEFERLRYLAYTADKELTLAMGSPARRQWRLCVLITESLCTHHPWHTVAERALEGGADCLQLREKALDDRELVRRARALDCLARSRGACTIVNDRPDIALLAGAHGVHLGQMDLSVHAVRELAGTRLLVGVSTANIDQAGEAADAGADVIALGPMFRTTTKNKPRLAGPEYLLAYMSDERLSRIPHVAIGGINPDNAHELAKAGCRGIAVSSFVCGAKDPAQACRSLLDAFAKV